MPRFRSNLNHNGIAFGEVIEIPDHELEAWRAEIEASFLTPVDLDFVMPAPYLPESPAPTSDAE